VYLCRGYGHHAGITCRWATKHAAFDQLTQQHLIKPQQRGDTGQPAAATSSAGAGSAEAPGTADGAAGAAAQPAALVRAVAADDAAQPAEDATWASGSTAPLQRSSEAAASAAATAPAPALAADAAESAHPAGSNGTAAPHSDAAWLNGVSGSGSAVQPMAAAPMIDELPVAAELPDSTNTLSKDVQIRLRCAYGMFRRPTKDITSQCAALSRRLWTGCLNTFQAA
jgi:hypothetical protein